MSKPEPDHVSSDNYTGPERRRNPPAPATKKFVVIFFVLTCIMVTGVFGYAQTKFSGVDEGSRRTTYLNQLDSCIRGFDIRNEFANRITDHITDAQNLLDLATALTNTRAAEARAFAAINNRFPNAIPELNDLIKTYENAQEADAKIAKSQKKISFKVLATVNCLNDVKRPPNTDIDIPQETLEEIRRQETPVIPRTTLTTPTPQK